MLVQRTIPVWVPAGSSTVLFDVGEEMAYRFVRAFFECTTAGGGGYAPNLRLRDATTKTVAEWLTVEPSTGGVVAPATTVTRVMIESGEPHHAVFNPNISGVIYVRLRVPKDLIVLKNEHLFLVFLGLAPTGTGFEIQLTIAFDDGN